MLSAGAATWLDAATASTDGISGPYFSRLGENAYPWGQKESSQILTGVARDLSMRSHRPLSDFVSIERRNQRALSISRSRFQPGCTASTVYPGPGRIKMSWARKPVEDLLIGCRTLPIYASRYAGSHRRAGSATGCYELLPRSVTSQVRNNRVTLETDLAESMILSEVEMIAIL